MSIEALNWAMAQRTRNAATQCLLYVLANAADPDGVAFRWWKTDDHWWPYIMKRTRLARASVFRILGELEDVGLIERAYETPEQGGRSQPVIALCLKTQSQAETQSHSETGEDEILERPPLENAPQSQAETGNPPPQSHAETHPPAPVSQGDPNQSQAETAYNPFTKNPSSHPPNFSRSEGEEGRQDKQGEAKPPLAKQPEPPGFNGFITRYPGYELFDRAEAAEAYRELSIADRRKADERVDAYARAIRTYNRTPINPARWLRKRRFDHIGEPSVTAAMADYQFAAEGTPLWTAACNFAAITSGGSFHIPHFWKAVGPHGERGARIRAAWVPTLEKLLVPREAWLFEERFTPQFQRWSERVAEMTGRTPMLIKGNAYQSHRLIARDQGKWGEREYLGLLVPLEWPPAKHKPPEAGEANKQTGPPPPITDDDIAVLANERMR